MIEGAVNTSNNFEYKKMANHLCFAIFLFIFLFFLRINNSQGVSAYDLINLINGMRSSNGLGALSVDSALMACAQSTAETMAASNMTWHIGNVSGRASSFGYNNYNTCFATENFTMGPATMSISEVAASWADATHMIPATSSSYCHIGAGVAAAGNGLVYYVVQAAYPAGSNGCGYAKGTGSGTSGNTGGGTVGGSASFIQAVVTSTPNENGSVIHTVQEGQSLWSISQAYEVSIEDIQAWNKMYNSTALSLGQELYIPSKDEAGHTPTPEAALTVFPTADSRGKFFHVVSDGDTLWSISELWNVPLNLIYQANGMNADSSIGLGWEIAIPVTATMTPLPTQTPTITPSPTETEVPTETPSAEIKTPDVSADQTNNAGFLHAPQSNSKTLLFSGFIFAIIIGGTMIVIHNIWKEK